MRNTAATGEWAGVGPEFITRRVMRVVLLVWAAGGCLQLAAQDGAAVKIRYKLTARDVVASRVADALKRNADRGAKLRDMFADAGCAGDELQLQAVTGTPAPNVICTIGGATDSVIVVGAHFDHAERGLGVIDNWGGAALLPSLAESVRSSGRRHTFVFAGFTDEEKGLVGSYFYVSQLGKEQIQRIAAMINFDSVGAGPTEVQQSTADEVLLHKLMDVTDMMKLPLSLMNVEQVGTSDFASFSSKRVPTLIFHSITPKNYKLLHTARDNATALKLDDYYDSYRIGALYLAYLDVVLGVQARHEEAPPPSLRRARE